MITVEDFNSVLYEFGGCNSYHCIDTSLISDEYDFDGIKYDFCIVERETTGTDEYTFDIQVCNGAWTGGYWITTSDDSYVSDATVSFSRGVLTIITDQPTIKLFLYLCNVAHSFQLERLSYIILNNKTQGIASNRRATLQNPFLHFKLLDGSMPDSLSMSTVGGDSGLVTLVQDPLVEEEYRSNRVRNWFYEGSMKLTGNYVNRLYFLNELVTVELPLSVSGGSFVKGKVNNVSLTLDKGEYPILYGTAYCNNQVIDFSVSDDGISFDLDLSDYYKDSILLTVFLHPNSDFFGWTYSLRVPVVNTIVSDYDGLVAECGTGGAKLFELGSDLSLSDDVAVEHNVKIMGNGHTLDCDGHSLVVDKGLDLSDCTLSNGDNAIVQKADSSVICTGVTFTNCVSSEYSNLGSCIYCDIDLDSLDVEDDFSTILTGCEFYDNQSAILQGGTLVMDGCKLHNTDLTYLDKHNVALLYQTDGNATIRNSIFDIDYTDTTLCENEQSIGFAQCLFRLGTSARLNGHSYTDIRDNGLEITSNACHIFAKYYYPTLEECVFTSPILSKEDSAFCYCLTGLNKVFKHNVQITKASDNAENTYRKIEW